MIESELKPCPFCGSPAFMRSGKEDFGRVRVGCSNEDCTARTTIVGYHKDEWAIEAWNTRHTPDITELQAENAKLRERLAAVEGEQERLFDNSVELGDVLEEIAGKILRGELDRKYWQGKKDGIRLSLALLHPDLPGIWVSSLKTSHHSDFLEGEEGLMERAEAQKREHQKREREQQPDAPQGGESEPSPYLSR